MAKLSAHGKELARVESTEVEGDTTVRTTLALFEDGHILYKANFTSAADGSKHGGSWSRFGRLKAVNAATAKRWVESQKHLGFTEVK